MRRNTWKFRKYLLGAALMTPAIPVFAAGSFTIMYGNKSLNANNWQPVESQREIGFGVEFQGSDWPVAIIARYSISEGSATAVGFGSTLKIEGTTTETGLGVRRYLLATRSRPFIEAGLVAVTANLSVEIAGYSASDSDSNTGLWVGAGIHTLLSDAWSIGLLGRLSTADVTLGGFTGDAGGRHFNISITHHFD